jgi:hypothetical protein
MHFSICSCVLRVPYIFSSLKILIMFSKEHKSPIPVAARSNAWVCGRFVAKTAGSSPARGMDVCLLCLYVVLSYVGRGLCDGLITRPEESYRASNCMWLRNLKTEDKAKLKRAVKLDKRKSTNHEAPRHDDWKTKAEKTAVIFLMSQISVDKLAARGPHRVRRLFVSRHTKLFLTLLLVITISIYFLSGMIWKKTCHYLVSCFAHK